MRNKNILVLPSGFFRWASSLLKASFCFASKLIWRSVVDLWHMERFSVNLCPPPLERCMTWGLQRWCLTPGRLWSLGSWQSRLSVMSRVAGDPPGWLSPPHRESLCSSLWTVKIKMRLKVLYFTHFQSFFLFFILGCSSIACFLLGKKIALEWHI